MADFHFFRRGGSDQLRIEKPEDLNAVETLDQKLWVALSMPVAGQELDERTLALLDADADGRVRVPEILAAVKFMRENTKDFSAFFAGKDEIALSAVAPDGIVAAAAKKILERLGKPDAEQLTLADVESATQTFDAQPFNGDGVIVPASAGDAAALAGFIRDAVAADGGSDDASGEKGVTAEQAAAFAQGAADVLAWRDRADASAAEILPFGAGTEAALDAFEAVRAKIDDFFARVRLAGFDASSAGTLNPSAADFAALAGADISADASRAFPISRIAAPEGEPRLPLRAGVNPAWVGALDAFVEKALVPAAEKIGGVPGEAPAELSASQWEKICALFAPCEAWLASKPGTGAAALSVERLREIVAGNFPEALAPLFEKDEAEKPLRAELAEAERFCRFTRDLARVLRNFVSFAEFYKRSADDTAFLVGKLYMDQRTCSLCVRVAGDPAAHAALAAKSNCCLAYCECVRGNEKMTVAAMFGDGDALSLYVGRNGVFYDKKGNDWDAKIVRIVENPISVRQAFWTPYRKFAKFIETQVESFAAAREKKADETLAGSAAAVPAAGKPGAKPAFDVAKFAGIFAAIGLALGAIGAALSVALTGFLSLAPWQMALVVVGIIALISAPSMLLAAVKLRRRSLGPILEAGGWAINGNVKIGIPLAKAFTDMPKKPAGSRTSGIDPYQEKSFPTGKMIAAAVVVVALLAVAALWSFCSGGEECVSAAPESAEAAVPAAEAPAAPETVPAADGNAA